MDDVQSSNAQASLRATDPPSPRLGGNPGGATASAIGISLMIFLLLPISQYLSWQKDPNIHRVNNSVLPPPPPPPPEPPPPEEEEEEEEEIEMEEQRTPPSLSQLELSLNADVNLGSADFGVPLFEVNEGLLGDMIFDLEDLDEVPRPLQQIAPAYPDRLRRQGIRGKANVLFVVDETGRVISPRIEKSTHSDFDRPALEAIRKWRFTAGVKDGRKVKTRMRQPFSFSLN